MKVTETIERECCDPRDLVWVNHKSLSKLDGDDVGVCKHCGQAWVSYNGHDAPGSKAGSRERICITGYEALK